MYIDRLLQVPKEQSFFLFGPRGTGKSTWLRKKFPGALFIDLLLPEQERRFLSKPEHLFELVNSVPDRQIIVLDEIQTVPSLLPVIHSCIENQKNVQFIMTGSSVRKLRRETGNLLGGRAYIKYMSAFLAFELKEHFNLEEALKTGLIPMIWQSKDRTEKLQSYCGAYLREEILAEGLVRQAGDFARFLEVCSFFHAQTLNVNEIAREAQVKRSTVDNYLLILEDLLIAYTLPVFTRRAKRMLAQHPKFYFFDTGLYRILRPKGPMDSDCELEGASIEGLVAQHLKGWVDFQKENYQFCFWRTKSQLEVDFIIYGPKGFWAIEVKRGKNVHPHDLKGLKHFLEDYPESKGIFLYQGERALVVDGILCLPVKEFLLNLNPEGPIYSEK